MEAATRRALSEPDSAVGEVSHEPAEHAEGNRVDLVIFGLVGAAALVNWLGLVPTIKGIDVLAVTAVLGGGYSVFREALENLLARRMTMELSMTIALAAALAIREFTTALFILFFVLGAEILEHLTVDRGRKAIRNLLALLPKRALVRRAGEVAELPIDEVRVGDVVVIRPAAEIPVDGVVVLGWSCAWRMASISSAFDFPGPAAPPKRRYSASEA